jgi:hypothetical protein
MALCDGMDRIMRSIMRSAHYAALLCDKCALCTALCTAWGSRVPVSEDNETTLYKVYHEDGDYEEMDTDELKSTISLFNQRQSSVVPDP